MTPSEQWKRSVAACCAMVALLACGGTARQAAPPAPATDTRAADLRAQLDWLLGEHVLLSSKATNAILGGRTDEAAAYQDLLARNGNDLGDLVGSALGSEAQARFDQLWIVDDGAIGQYTNAATKRDRTTQDRTMAQLTTGFVPQFAAFVSSATGLSADAVSALAKTYVLNVQQVVDDQASRTPTTYTDVRKAYAQMQVMGDTLAPAIATRERLMGSPATRAADLRVALDQLLQEHLYLSTDASDAELGGRTPEFQAASQALGDNGVDLGRVLGGVYDAGVQQQFDQLWSDHDGLFADYTLAVARKDASARQRALDDLTNDSVPRLAAFLAAASGLPVDTLSNLVQEHVLSARDVVDAQAAHHAADAAQRDRVAARHMGMIGDRLAAAIVKKLPRKFS